MRPDITGAESGHIPPVNGTDGRGACSEVPKQGVETTDRKFWVAAYTRPRSEKKAAAAMESLGLQTYTPVQKQLREWSDRRKMVETVVIPMIIFLRGSEESLKHVDRHSAILRLLSRPGENRPAAIPDYQIERLRFLLGHSDVPVTFDSRAFSVKDNVRIIRGRLRGVEGCVTECPDGSLDLTVSIDLLGGARLKVSRTDLERLD